MQTDYLYRCDYCEKPFKSEKWFLKHQCKEMIRAKEFRSALGQGAWIHYKSWMKLKRFKVVAGAETFIKSQYFKAFYEFTKFIKRSQMPDVKMYMGLMIRNTIDPKHWTTDIAYGKYLNHLTRVASAQDLAKITIDTIFDLADAGNVNTEEVFDLLTANEVIQLLNQRRLSPFILLNSKKFADFYEKNTTNEERIILETIINPEYWQQRFKKNPNDVANIQKYITELGL